MEIFRVFRGDRHPNRAVPVLFARRNIKIGEELTFNYRMITSETVDSGDEENQTDHIKAEKRNFKCLCNARNCPDKVWTPEEWKKEETRRKNREKGNAKKMQNAKKRNSSTKEGNRKSRKRKRDSLNDTL